VRLSTIGAAPPAKAGYKVRYPMAARPTPRDPKMGASRGGWSLHTGTRSLCCCCPLRNHGRPALRAAFLF